MSESVLTQAVEEYVVGNAQLDKVGQHAVRALYPFIVWHWVTHQSFPTRRQMQVATGLSSTSLVQLRLEQLVELGLVKRKSDNNMVLVGSSVGYKVRDAIEATKKHNQWG